MNTKIKRILALLFLLMLALCFTGCASKSRIGLWRNSEAFQSTTGGSSGVYWCFEIADNDTDTIYYSCRYIDGTLADSDISDGTFRDEGGGRFSTPSLGGQRNYFTYHADTDTITYSDMTFIRIR